MSKTIKRIDKYLGEATFLPRITDKERKWLEDVGYWSSVVLPRDEKEWEPHQRSAIKKLLKAKMVKVTSDNWYRRKDLIEYSFSDSFFRHFTPGHNPWKGLSSL